MPNPIMRGTTVIVIRKGDQVVMAGDGQVTMGETIVKQQAKKIRRLYRDKILTGFAGSTADAFTLFERLEALLLAADAKDSFILSGTGDVIEPDDGFAAVGSGAPYALAAARALDRHTDLSARQIAEEAMSIAASICVYTNTQFVIEEL